MGSQPFNEIDDCAHGRSQDNYVTSLAGFYWIYDSLVDGFNFLGAAQNIWVIAADDLALKSFFSERQAERSPNQACTNDRDLTNGHGNTIKSLNHCVIESLTRGSLY